MKQIRSESGHLVGIITSLGEWSVEPCPVGLQAAHPDYDGAEDGCLDCVYGVNEQHLMDEVEMWEQDNSRVFD